ncbi:MAG TPA: cyclic nucleotide-binding domain-containing protein [Kiloniellaceae bacterium]|nr:cyclic nucleotide-binding domain-containing protein [Kiloniellaceae bacterium]
MNAPIDPSEFSCLRSYTAGQVIFNEGEVGDCAFVVCEGSVEIFKGGRQRALRLATCEAGGIFGEMALVDDAPRSASARALTPASCLVLPKERFRHLFEEADPFARALLRILVANVRETSDTMVLFHRALSDLRHELNLPPADARSLAAPAPDCPL